MTPTARRRPLGLLRTLGKHFVRGLIVVVPIAATAAAVYVVFVEVDAWINVEPLLNRRVPGAGILLTAAFITLVGALASNVATRWLFAILEDALGRTPLVKLLYTSIKDLVGAFVGDKKRFDRPVLVSLAKGSDVATIGFVTRSALGDVGLDDHVAVYVPQAYNIGGNVVVVPRERVKPLDGEPASVMAFVVSGGISGELSRLPAVRKTHRA